MNTADATHTAAKLLNTARAASPGRPEGTITVKTSREVVVTWNRVERTYDVGTPAKSYAEGPRRVVLPVLEGLLSGV